MGRRALALVALTALLSGCGSSRQEPVGSARAPGIELKDLSGKLVRLSDFSGHPVLLDFWATWCGPCRISIPMVQQFYERHKADGLAVLGLNVDDDPAGVVPFVRHFGVTYPVLYAGASAATADYQVEGLPTFVLIDPQGKVIERFDGFSPEMFRVLEADLERLRTTPR